MDKIILKHREFKENLVNLINEAGLPAFVLKPIMTELLEQLNQLEETQYQQALEIQKQEEKEDDKEDRKEEE